MAKPRVFVSSTYYDLKHIRNSLRAFIETVGYEAILFESGDIPFRHDIPLDESCYSEIQNCHMLVLIVGGRYGSAVSSEPATKVKGEDKAYEFYNSITRREYEAARKRDIPIFIFVEKNVLSEFRTFKENRENKTISYAHVDSVNIYHLLESILVQRRNNYLKEFDHFDDISSWLRDQWAGLFADQLARQSREVAIEDLASQVTSLAQLTGVLKEYTESIMRKVEPEESKQIISAQHKVLRTSKVNRFKSEPLISFLLSTREHLTPLKAFNSFSKSTSLENFLGKIDFTPEENSEFRFVHEKASKDYHEIFKRYFDQATEDVDDE